MKDTTAKNTIKKADVPNVNVKANANQDELIALDTINEPGANESEQKDKNEIDWPYNKRTRENYEKNGFKVPEGLDGQELAFLNLVSLEQGPIERQITRLVRLRHRDFDSGNWMVMREYLIWYENWFGKDWMGADIPPVTDHVHGVCMMPTFRTVVDRDMKTGRVLPAQKKLTGQTEVYFVPFEGKEQVDRIIGDRDKDSLIYTIKFPATPNGGSGIRNNFSYYHFVNLSMDEAFKLNAKAGGSAFNQLTQANAMREGGVS